MIYVARIDDAFARFKLQRPIFSRYPRSAFSFSKRYKFPVSNSQREKYYISNSVASIHPIHSVNLIESRADFFFPPSSLLLSVNSTVINLITYREIIVCVTKDSFLLLREKRKTHNLERIKGIENQSVGLYRGKRGPNLHLYCGGWIFLQGVGRHREMALGSISKS